MTEQFDMSFARIPRAEWGLSRRGFIVAAALAAVASKVGRAVTPATRPVALPSGLVRLPAKGRLFVASDFHTRHADFRKWLERTDLPARLKAGEDVYGIILGDAADQKAGDALAEADGDSRIIDEIRRIQAGERGDRLIFIRGNHEHEVARIYRALQNQYGMTPKTQKLWANRLFNSADGAYFAQFNFLLRATPEQVAYMEQVPLAVITAGGLLFTHAGPAPSATGPRSLAEREPKVIEELVWPRPAAVSEGGFTPDQVEGFLRVMDQSDLLIVGHTPVAALPAEMVRNTLGVYGQHMAILGTSYGSEDAQRSYLDLDLAQRFPSVGDLALGKQIVKLIA